MANATFVIVKTVPLLGAYNVNEYILYLLTTLPEKFETGFVVDDYLPWAVEMQKQFKMK